MVYYNIRVFSASKDMMTIAPELVKFKYNCLPMGICASRYIFKSKVDEPLCDIDGIETYIDDILS